MTDSWKELAYKHIEDALKKYDLQEADVSFDYERQKVDINIKLNMSKFRETK